MAPKKPTAGSSKLAGSPMFAASPGNSNSPDPTLPHRPDIRPSDSATSYFGVVPSTSLSTSPRPIWSSPPQRSGQSPPESRRVSLSGMATPASALKGRFRHLQRGMTMEEVQQYGVLNDEEGSAAFNDMELDENDIKKLPKKLRPYYEHLALLKGHYEEVDQILSGELPKTIAKSFKQPPDGKPSLNGGYGTMHRGVEGEGATPWLHGSRTGRSHGKVNGHQRKRSSSTIRPGENGDAEAGEGDVLLTGAEKEERRERLAKIALNVNILLTLAKLVAVLYSSSISLLASLVDSALDTLSTFIILGTSYAIGIKSDKHLYPAGKRRFEPLGVLIFSVAMIASFVQVFIEAFDRARNNTGEPPVDLSAIGLSTMLATIAVKSVLWLWCSRMPSSGVQALAQDAENDVWLNTMSLAFPWIGVKIGWRLLDPIGGMVLSTYIIFEWIKTLLQNFAKLSGKTASRDQLTRVLYLVTRFNPVLEIKEIECYHIGDDLIVEVDVIFPQASSLHFAHDVSETIQCVLESLDGVLRAYVHPDYSSDNPHQHTLRLAPSNAINLPDRADGSQTPPGSLTPTNKTMMAHQHRVIGDIQEQSVDSVRASGILEHGSGSGVPV